MSRKKLSAFNWTAGARGLFQICFLAAAFASLSLNAQSNTAATPPVIGEETNSLETLHSVLKLQEQLSATQLAIERNQREADAAATRRAETVDSRLNSGIEQKLYRRRNGPRNWKPFRATTKSC